MVSVLVAVMTTASIACIIGAVGINQRDSIQNFIEANGQVEKETSEQTQAGVEDPSAKYYAEPPKENKCSLSEHTEREGATLRCTFADMSSSASVVSEDSIDLVKNRLSYCNEIIQHRSAGLDMTAMSRCLYDVQE